MPEPIVENAPQFREKSFGEMFRAKAQRRKKNLCVFAPLREISLCEKRPLRETPLLLPKSKK
jgi:hypothetical protein